MTSFKNPRAWFYGLISGIIGGSATSGVSWLGMNVAKAAGADLPELNLKALGIILACGAVSTALAYLAKSPLPPIAEEDTDFTEKK